MEATAINNIQTTNPQDSNVRNVSSPDEEQGQKHEQETIPAYNKKDRGGQLNTATDEINKFLESMDTSLRFSIHKDSGRVAVKVVNNKTQEVVREIPPEKILRLAANMKDITGIIVDKAI